MLTLICSTTFTFSVGVFFVHNLYRNSVEKFHTLDKFHCSKSWNTFSNKLLSEWRQISAREEFRGKLGLDLLEVKSAVNVCTYFRGRVEVWFLGHLVLCLSEAFASTSFPDWVCLNCFLNLKLTTEEETKPTGNSDYDVVKLRGRKKKIPNSPQSSTGRCKSQI